MSFLASPGGQVLLACEPCVTPGLPVVPALAPAEFVPLPEPVVPVPAVVPVPVVVPVPEVPVPVPAVVPVPEVPWPLPGIMLTPFGSWRERRLDPGPYTLTVLSLVFVFVLVLVLVFVLELVAFEALPDTEPESAPAPDVALGVVDVVGEGLEV